MVKVINENYSNKNLNTILNYIVKNHQVDRSAGRLTVEYDRELDSVVVENDKGKIVIYYSEILDPYHDNISVYGIIDIYDETHITNDYIDFVSTIERQIEILLGH